MRNVDTSNDGVFDMSQNGGMMFQFVERWTYRLDGYGGVSNCDLCDIFDPVYEYTRLEDGRVMFMCKDCQADLKL